MMSSMSYLARLPNARPVLQIIHVSDLHVLATNNHPAAPAVRWMARWARKIGHTDLEEKLQDGTAPSCTMAPKVFPDFVRRITVGDPVWSACPTWLVDTGDQTTFGDDASFTVARQYLASFVAAAGPFATNGALVNLHGNHDAWPEDVPLLAARKIRRHTTAIAAAPLQYAVRCAQAPLRAPLPVNGEIQLFTMDTVSDRPWRNTLARGFVDRAQLKQIHTLMQNHQGAASAQHLRIVATHHPVHFPPPRPQYVMVIANEQDVRRSLRSGPPFVHLVLSGHNHALYPEHARLPHSPRICPQCSLGTDQCQLVVGTLMQEDLFQKRGDHPHQCQVLRFYQDPGTPALVLLQRLLAARNPYQSRIDYDFVPVPGNSGAEAEIEEILIAL